MTTTALVMAAVLPAHAATWFVASYGDDAFNTPTCGAKTLPCRSVSKAISLAAGGDTIIVGPGVYGDLNASGTFGDFPGEETAEIGSGCNCMIKVSKQLTIVSRDGAEVTTFDAAFLTQNVVDIQIAGTIFGKPSKGFTIRNGLASGLLIDSAVSSGNVAGNIATSNLTGFEVNVSGSLTDKPIVTDNIAVDNSGSGFLVNGDFNTLQRNRATGNAGAGFAITGTGENLKQNVAVANNNGFEIDMEPPGHPFANCPSCFGFTNNGAIANNLAGVFVQAMGAAGGLAFLQKSNAFGNGDAANNCGASVDNQVSMNTMGASFNIFYWGAATGIGANPADTAGGVCLTGAGAGSVAEFSGTPAAKEFVFGEKPLK